MKIPSRTMCKSSSVVCPTRAQRTRAPGGTDPAGCAFDGVIVGTLEQIAALPDPRCAACPTECSTAPPAAQRSYPSKLALLTFSSIRIGNR